MTIWANRKAQRDLIEFRNLVVEYFNNAIVHNPIGSQISENNTANLARRKINLMSNRVARWAAATGHDSEILYREAPMFGGRAYPIHLISNVFNFDKLELEPKTLTDVLEKALGVYQDDETYSVIRTCNPVFWIGRLFDLISSIPFMLLGRIGFSQDKAEASIVGRAVKGMLYAIQVFAAFLAIAEKLGFLDRLKTLLNYAH